MIILRQREFVGKSNPVLNFMNTKGNGAENKQLKRIGESGIKATSVKNFQQYEKNNPQKVASRIKAGRQTGQSSNQYLSGAQGGLRFNTDTDPHSSGGNTEPPIISNARMTGYNISSARYPRNNQTMGSINAFDKTKPLNIKRMQNGAPSNIDKTINLNAASARQSRQLSESNPIKLSSQGSGKFGGRQIL